MTLWSSRLSATLLAVCFLAAAPALAKPKSLDPEKVLGGVCDATQSVGFCFYFIGAKYAEDQLVNGNQHACRLFRGKFKPVGGKCPQANRAGRCRIKHETPEAMTLLYYFPRHDIAKAQADCERPAGGAQGAVTGAWFAE